MGKTQHNLTPGDWKAGFSARQRHDWSDYTSGWLYVDAENFIGQNVSRHLPYTNNDVICMAAAKKMLWALRSARALIGTLPIDAFGSAHDPTVGHWPIRDELLDQINKALPEFPEEEEEKEEKEEKEMVDLLVLADENAKNTGRLHLVPQDDNRVEVDVVGDSTVLLTYKELEEALTYLQGKSLIR